jgi:hypothetical protein
MAEAKDEERDDAIPAIDDRLIGALFDLRAIENGHTPRRRNRDGEPTEKLRDVALLIRFDRSGNAIATIGGITESGTQIVAALERNRSSSASTAQAAVALLLDDLRGVLRRRQETHERDAQILAAALDSVP